MKKLEFPNSKINLLFIFIFLFVLISIVGVWAGNCTSTVSVVSASIRLSGSKTLANLSCVYLDLNNQSMLNRSLDNRTYYLYTHLYSDANDVIIDISDKDVDQVYILNDNAIRVTSGNATLIFNNTIVSSWNGTNYLQSVSGPSAFIRVSSTTRIYAVNTTFNYLGNSTSPYYGILVDSTNNNSYFYNNRIYNNYMGLSVSGPNVINISNNFFNGTSYAQVYIPTTTKNVLSNINNNIFNNFQGKALYMSFTSGYSDSLNFINNTIYSPFSAYLLYFTNLRNSNISDNNVSCGFFLNSIGFYTNADSYNNFYYNNKFNNCYTGFYMLNESNSIIDSNTFLGNISSVSSYDGVYLYHSQNTTIRNSNFSYHDAGIRLYNNTITNLSFNLFRNNYNNIYSTLNRDGFSSYLNNYSSTSNKNIYSAYDNNLSFFGDNINQFGGSNAMYFYADQNLTLYNLTISSDERVLFYQIYKLNFTLATINPISYVGFLDVINRSSSYGLTLSNLNITNSTWYSIIFANDTQNVTLKDSYFDYADIALELRMDVKNIDVINNTFSNIYKHYDIYDTAIYILNDRNIPNERARNIRIINNTFNNFGCTGQLIRGVDGYVSYGNIYYQDLNYLLTKSYHCFAEPLTAIFIHQVYKGFVPPGTLATDNYTITNQHISNNISIYNENFSNVNVMIRNQGGFNFTTNITGYFYKKYQNPYLSDTDEYFINDQYNDLMSIFPFGNLTNTTFWWGLPSYRNFNYSMSKSFDFFENIDIYSLNRSLYIFNLSNDVIYFHNQLILTNITNQQINYTLLLLDKLYRFNSTLFNTTKSWTNALFFYPNKSVNTNLRTITSNDGYFNVNTLIDSANNMSYALDNYILEETPKTNEPFQLIKTATSTLITYKIRSNLTNNVTVPINLSGISTCIGLTSLKITPKGGTELSYTDSASMTRICNELKSGIYNITLTQSNDSNTVILDYTLTPGGSGGGGGSGVVIKDNCMMIYDFILKYYNSSSRKLEFTNNEFENLKLSTLLTTNELNNYLNYYPILCANYSTLPFIDYSPQNIPKELINTSPNIEDVKALGEGVRSMWQFILDNIIFILLIIIIIVIVEYLSRK